MIADLLRTETADKHKKLESLMFVKEIMNHTLSVEDYKTLLTVNYIIHQKTENVLANMLDVSLADAIDMKNRLKLTALEKDLNYWQIDNLTLPELNFKLFIPDKNMAEVLGALYVLEGATLGGNVIKKHLLANPNFKAHEEGLNYYGVYGNDLSIKWKAFISVLNANVTSADYDRCIASANNTFQNLINLSMQLKSSSNNQ